MWEWEANSTSSSPNSTRCGNSDRSFPDHSLASGRRPPTRFLVFVLFLFLQTSPCFLQPNNPHLKYLTTSKIDCQKNLGNFISLRNIEENQKKKSLLHLPLSNPKIHSFAFCQIEMTANNIIRAFTFTFMQSFAFCGGPMYARKKCNQSAPQHKRDTCNRCAMLIQWLQNNKNCPKPRDITHFKWNVLSFFQKKFFKF